MRAATESRDRAKAARERAHASSPDRHGIAASTRGVTRDARSWPTARKTRLLAGMPVDRKARTRAVVVCAAWFAALLLMLGATETRAGVRDEGDRLRPVAASMDRAGDCRVRGAAAVPDLRR